MFSRKPPLARHGKAYMAWRRQTPAGGEQGSCTRVPLLCANSGCPATCLQQQLVGCYPPCWQVHDPHGLGCRLQQRVLPQRQRQRALRVPHRGQRSQECQRLAAHRCKVRLAVGLQAHLDIEGDLVGLAGGRCCTGVSVKRAYRHGHGCRSAVRKWLCSVLRQHRRCCHARVAALQQPLSLSGSGCCRLTDLRWRGQSSCVSPMSSRARCARRSARETREGRLVCE